MSRRAIAKIISILWASLLLTFPALAQPHGDGCITSLFAGDPSGDYFIAAMGANSVIYYTFIDTFRTESWDFNLGPESTNPFARPPLNKPVDTDSGSPFPGRAGVDVPWQPIPSSAAASSGPFCTTVRTGTGENEIEIFVRGNDGNLYWTVFDPFTGGNSAPYSGVHASFNNPPFNGDPDADGWPGRAGQSPWRRVE